MVSFDQKKYVAGDRLAIITSTDSYEGAFLPSENPSVLTLKLDNGYNVGVKIANIKSASLVKAYKAPKTPKDDVKQNTSLPRVAILHTGGTIASKVDYATGGVTANFTPEKLLSMFPELAQIAFIDSHLVRQMMSENMRFSHYNLLAKAVKKEIDKGADGVIVTQGTDTLHYTAAALSFALENLPVPVMVVGAQRSSDRGSSDAAQNLIAATKFMTKTDFSEVAVCMHNNMQDENCLIIPGVKVRKMHTSRRDAFRPVNGKAFATIDVKTDKIIFSDRPFVKKDPSRKLKLRLFNEDLKVGLLKSHTNMFAEQFLAYKGFDGLVVEGTALGQLPNSKVDEFTAESEKIIDAVRLLTSKMPVVMASQCIYGRVDMNVYKEGRINLQAGVLGNFSDMTPETTFIKLAWLLSNYDKDEVAALIGTDLRGEISERIEDDEFLN